MAWIESHQELATNPKTKRAARMLDVPIAQVVGHLHMLWWWTLDHAFDGDLSAYEALDIAEACGWDGDPDVIVEVLIGCGPANKSGFLEPDWRVHDWGQFTKHLRARREASAYANHVKWHVKRGKPDTSCPNCFPTDSGQSPNGVRTGGAADSTGTGTEPEPEPDQQTASPDGAAGEDQQQPDEAEQQFEEHFWPAYPERDGKKKAKGKALIQWRKLTLAQRRRALNGAKNLAKSGEKPKDAHRFLRRDTAGEFPFDDWQTPAKPSDGPRGSPPRPTFCDLCPGDRSHLDYCPNYSPPDTSHADLGGAA